jgi:ABC-2 type transport system ATP-binding protein
MVYLLNYSYDSSGENIGVTKILDILASEQIIFKDLHTSQSSLEDIFVSLVSLDEGAKCT